MLIIATLAAFLLCACSGCDDNTKTDRSLRVEVVAVNFITWPTTGHSARPTLPGEAYTDYSLTARIYGSGVAQELVYTASATPRRRAVDNSLVEFFGIKSEGWEYAIDNHVGRNHSTCAITCYTATCDGADYLNGYAMLPQNLDGSFTTNQSAVEMLPGDVYDYRHNPYYLDAHTVTGWLGSASADRIQWAITADDSGLTITIDGVDTHYPAP